VAMSSRRLSIAVIQGGPSMEAEVSRASALGVARALSGRGHGVVRLELDSFLPESLRTGGYDVVFPVVHGAVGEDGSLQGLLEVLDLPYVGSDVLSSALAMNKRVARLLLERAGLPIARGVTLSRGDARSGADRARREVGARLVIKPSASGSAIGVYRLEKDAAASDVENALEAVWAIDDFAIVEHFARGREVTCGVLEPFEGAEGAAIASRLPSPLPLIEILSPRDPFYTYEARYTPGRSVHVCPAKIDPRVAARVQEIAVEAHVALGCRDLSRVDFIVGDDGDPDVITLLEVNTLPGMTATSLFPEAAATPAGNRAGEGEGTDEPRGIEMAVLCEGLAMRAYARGPTRRLAARPMPAVSGPSKERSG
jgi:D-alanine-D-alanine ligase